MAQGNAKKIGLDHGDLVGKDDDDHSFYPKGVVDWVTSTTNSSNLAAGGDITDMSLTVTLDSSRTYRIHGRVPLYADDESAVFSLELHEDGVQIQEANGSHATTMGSSASTQAHLDVVYILAGNDASTTYKLRGSRVQGSGEVHSSVHAIRPAFFLIEDIGPA